MDIYVRLLGLVEGYTLDQLKAAYRQKAHLHHPDRGGDPDIFRIVREAYEELVKAFEPKPEPTRRTRSTSSSPQPAGSNTWLDWAESLRPSDEKPGR